MGEIQWKALFVCLIFYSVFWKYLDSWMIYMNCPICKFLELETLNYLSDINVLTLHLSYRYVIYMWKICIIWNRII